jgi:hypothetical protein
MIHPDDFIDNMSFYRGHYAAAKMTRDQISFQMPLHSAVEGEYRPMG